MSRRRIAIAAVPAAALAAAGAIVATSGGSGGTGGARAASAGHTMAVERRTLVARERVDGTLGYSGERAVAGQVRGTITSLPAEGDVIRPGHALLTVDRRPVVLMDGTVPAFRPLRAGLAGQDVRQLEQGLADLGYDPGDVDGRYTAATVAAVKAWQDDRGLSQTGSVELGRIVFLPGARRITKVRGELGGQATGPLLDTTSTHKVVTAKLDATDQGLAARGRRVRVELPDGRVASGRIASVGTVATADDGGDGGGGGGGDDGDGEAQVTVRISLRSRAAAGRFDEAPVSVQFAQTTRRHVLAVPVESLVARRGGGYAVELAGGRLVPVRPGLFADGYVELSGGAVHEGDRVRVPS